MAKIIGNTTATPMAIPDWSQNDPTKADYIKNKPKILYGDTLSFENVRKFYPDGKEVDAEFQSELSAYLAQSKAYCEKYDLNNDGVCNVDDLNTLLIWMQDPTVTAAVDGAKPGDYYFTKDGCIYVCTDIDKWAFVFSADVEVSSSVLKLTSNPTINTVGYVGQLCVNTTSNVVFICTGLSADYEYQWIPVVDNSTVITELQNKTKLLTTDQYTNSTLLFTGANFAPNTNAGTAELGAYGLPWKKVHFPMGANYGIDIAGNMVTTYELLCLTGARMNLQSAIDDLGTAVNNLASGKSSFREAEFANFDTYYNQTYTQRDYSLVPRCVAMGRRGHDIVSMVPYVYRPASVCNVTNASDGSKLYLSNVDSDFWLRGTYLFTASYHYLYDKTAGVYYKMRGQNSTTDSNSNSNSNSNSDSSVNSNTFPNTTVSTDSDIELIFNSNSMSYLQIENSTWGYDPTHEYVFYAMDWYPLFELAQNTEF